MNLNAKRLDVVCTIGSACEIREVKLNLVPAFVESHWHGADERLYSGGALVVGGTEPTADTLVVKHLDFEREVFLQLKDKRARVRI